MEKGRVPGTRREKDWAGKRMRSTTMGRGRGADALGRSQRLGRTMSHKKRTLIEDSFLKSSVIGAAGAGVLTHCAGSTDPAVSSSMLEPSAYLIVNGLVVTMDPERRVITEGAVAVNGNQIEAVGKTEDLRAGIRHLSHHRRGQGHHHARTGERPQSPFRHALERSGLRWSRVIEPVQLPMGHRQEAPTMTRHSAGLRRILPPSR